MRYIQIKNQKNLKIWSHKMKCSLDNDINKCPYFLLVEQECTSKSTCSFQEKSNSEIKCGYIRKNVGMKNIMKNVKNRDRRILPL